jgi:hypothetical protein
LSWAGRAAKAGAGSRRPTMLAILMIAVFIVVIGVLNRIDFGRVD